MNNKLKYLYLMIFIVCTKVACNCPDQIYSLEIGFCPTVYKRTKGEDEAAANNTCIFFQSVSYGLLFFKSLVHFFGTPDF